MRQPSRKLQASGMVYSYIDLKTERPKQPTTRITGGLALCHRYKGQMSGKVMATMMKMMIFNHTPTLV
jgi:hypothetical protein